MAKMRLFLLNPTYRSKDEEKVLSDSYMIIEGQDNGQPPPNAFEFGDYYYVRLYPDEHIQNKWRVAAGYAQVHKTNLTGLFKDIDGLQRHRYEEK